MQAGAALVVTPSDSTSLAATTTQLFISHNAAWTVQVTMENGDTVVLAGQGGNVVLPVRVTKVWVTGTHVGTTIIALF
jgi:hypothetical protein